MNVRMSGVGSILLRPFKQPEETDTRVVGYDWPRTRRWPDFISATVKINRPYGPFWVETDAIRKAIADNTDARGELNVKKAISKLGHESDTQYYHAQPSQLNVLLSPKVAHIKGARPVKVQYRISGHMTEIFITPLPKDTPEVLEAIQTAPTDTLELHWEGHPHQG